MLLELYMELVTMNSKRLNGKVAIITGAAQGQGKATALRFAQEGARVTCFDIQALDKIQETVDEIKKLESDGLAIRGDVSKASDIDTCINSTVERFGRIDVLVNCAGIMILKPFLEQTVEDFQRVMDVNVKGTFLFTQKVMPLMLNQGRGKIIIYASIDSFVAEENASPYIASKGALKSLTTALAVEFAAKGININAIAPGQIDTAMLRQATDGHPEVTELLIRNTPARRIGRSEDTVGAVVFLASDDADFVNGTTLVVDGGWLCL
jgi:NAD(P)-dependent dehydrogenase (short-subunit alcohol dehydrogenase family)